MKYSSYLIKIKNKSEKQNKIYHYNCYIWIHHYLKKQTITIQDRGSIYLISSPYFFALVYDFYLHKVVLILLDPTSHYLQKLFITKSDT